MARVWTPLGLLVCSVAFFFSTQVSFPQVRLTIAFFLPSFVCLLYLGHICVMNHCSACFLKPYKFETVVVMCEPVKLKVVRTRLLRFWLNVFNAGSFPKRYWGTWITGMHVCKPVYELYSNYNRNL